MPRHEFDKSSKWLVQRHGKSLLALAGVSGVSLAGIPSASETALLMQAGTGMVALSPTPFRPRGFRGDGVQMWDNRNSGTSHADGMR